MLLKFMRVWRDQKTETYPKLLLAKKYRDARPQIGHAVESQIGFRLIRQIGDSEI